MGLYTRITRDWLENRFRKRSDAGVYLAHMPIYGLGNGDCEVDQPRRIARMFRILRQLDALEYESLLDIGGAEGFLPHVANAIHGVEGFTTDLSHEACRRATELFGLPAAAVESHQLPFPDDEFDVVVCSEVIEHVEHPIETILELQRVARRAVILTTEELHYDRGFIDQYLFRRPGWPHMERNLFHPDDLRTCFPGAQLEPQFDSRPPKDVEDPASTRDWVLAHTQSTALEPGRIGILVTDLQDPDATRDRRHSDPELLDRLLAVRIDKAAAPQPSQPKALTECVTHLCDPVSRAPLRPHDEVLVSADGPHYEVRHGVPDFVRLQRPAPSRIALADHLDAHHPDNGAAMLALRDRLFLPDRWTQDHFDLRREEDRRGFWPNDQLRPRKNDPGSEPGFAWHATGPDPWLVTPCLQRPIREVELELRIHAPDNPVKAGTGQIFWKGPADDTFLEAHSVLFEVPNDGQVHKHRVALTSNPALPDEIQWLRIDPVDGECEVDLLSLRLI
ncbi:MAG: methyltransferase domain-containing protein [bacterium]|nr:methyltransferase domain-containing protein [bacterium]